MTEFSNDNYTEFTLCFPVRDGRVLLAEKQKKIGAGFLNGFGGKADPDDFDIYATNARELEEEAGIRVKTARKVGEIAFHNPSTDATLNKIIVHIFIATEWDGEPADTDEMKNINWHNINELDYDRFLSADRLFLPQVFAGNCIRGLIEYNDDWTVKTSHLENVPGF